MIIAHLQEHPMKHGGASVLKKNPCHLTYRHLAFDLIMYVKNLLLIILDDILHAGTDISHNSLHLLQ